MTTSQIIYEQSDSLAIVRLNRPEKLNALSREMITALSDAFRDLENQPALRAVILTGTGDRAFSVGTDINELAGLNQEEAAETSKRGQDLCQQIESYPVPVIAAINGLAVGGGCELALACHLRVASTNARFSLPEARLGVIPGCGGTQRLVRQISYGRALEVMLTGGSLSAAEALAVGLVNRVTDPAQVFSHAQSLADEIARLAPLAIRACLEAVTRGFDLPLKDGLALETRLFASLFGTDDMREGTRAFLEKRAPVFKGRKS
ncbi:MAG: enoyl-CoA hydratase/isomerase family protein [Pyrinomonadaceae bacterium]